MAELSVSRKSVEDLLSLSDVNKTGKIYVIPEYQRPYKWDLEKCETLWIDLSNFYNEASKQDDREYFLGTIVTCINAKEKRIDIIDGQQRITSLLLLLRAFYTQLEIMLENKPNDENIIGLMSSIEPCIWNIDKMSKKVTNKKDIHIKSLVITDKDNEIFHKILETGKTEEKSKSPYVENYKFFFSKCQEYAKDMPMDWKKLCLCILKRCIVLPIECEDLESALTIFGTLNDRGMPLSDSDIFKAELYKQKQTKEEKEDFTQHWKSLEETVFDGGFSLDDAFRYYMHIIRGRNKDKSDEIALRRFYAGSDNKYSKFKEPNFFEDIIKLASFWKSLNDRDDMTYCTLEAKIYIHCLTCYPNEYWKYPVSAFYNYHKNDDFKGLFVGFLKRLLAYLFIRFIESPAVNAIKDSIYKFCIEVSSSGDANFDYKIFDDFENKTLKSSSKITKPIILLNSYLFNKEQQLLPSNFEIEHIFPKKWQDTNYNGWTKDEAIDHLDMLGNKIAIEKKLNIQAGNGYFGQKKLRYSKSHIFEVKELSNYSSSDWLKEDINKRNKAIINSLRSFFEENLT